MTVLQLSDPHTEEFGVLAYHVADTASMMYNAVRAVKALRRPPDMVVVTGDIASEAKPGGYAVAADALGQLDMPVYVIPGNHDERDVFMRYLQEYCPADPQAAPALCYSVEGEEIRVICLDSTAPGSHSGHFSPNEACWLDKKLSEAPDKPTLVFMHHTPIFVGMKYMDEPFEGIELLAGIMRRNPQATLCCGHMHRAFSAQWQGRTVVSCPSCAMQMEIDLSERGGDTFFMEAPGYALHTLQHGRVISFFGQIPGAVAFTGPHPFLGINFPPAEK